MQQTKNLDNMKVEIWHNEETIEMDMEPALIPHADEFLMIPVKRLSFHITGRTFYYKGGKCVKIHLHTKEN